MPATGLLCRWFVPPDIHDKMIHQITSTKHSHHVQIDHLMAFQSVKFKFKNYVVHWPCKQPQMRNVLCKSPSVMNTGLCTESPCQCIMVIDPV